MYHVQSKHLRTSRKLGAIFVEIRPWAHPATSHCGTRKDGVMVVWKRSRGLRVRDSVQPKRYRPSHYLMAPIYRMLQIQRIVLVSRVSLVPMVTTQDVFRVVGHPESFSAKFITPSNDTIPDRCPVRQCPWKAQSFKTLEIIGDTPIVGRRLQL